jgi:hypothetical protein
MDKAAKDPAVKAVVIAAEHVSAGPAQVEELRQAIDQMKAGGKDVYVHADSASMGAYLLFSAATRLSVTPTADLWLGGIRAESPHVRGLLDKIGVEPDFIALGEYKSAAEMFTLTGPSKPAEEMMNWLLDGIYDAWVKQIAAGRKMQPEEVKQRLDVGLYSAEKAKAAGLGRRGGALGRISRRCCARSSAATSCSRSAATASRAEAGRLCRTRSRSCRSGRTCLARGAKGRAGRPSVAIGTSKGRSSQAARSPPVRRRRAGCRQQRHRRRPRTRPPRTTS